MEIRIEWCPRCAWHMDCPEREPGRAPMKWLDGSFTLKDGSVLREFACVVCGERGYGGCDKDGRCVSIPGPDIRTVMASREAIEKGDTQTVQEVLDELGGQS